MTETVLQHAFKTAGRMIAFAIVGTIILTAIYALTKEPIAENERKVKLALFKQVIPQSLYENDIINATQTLPPSPLLGTQHASQAHIAIKDKKVTGVILESIAPDGYGGAIKLLVGIDRNGVINGVRVVSHKETPGLGDYIDISKDKWIELFEGESLKKTSDKHWKVNKDGGKFDYRVGATITPRAVVNKVHQTLLYFKENQTTLLDIAQVETNNDETVSEN